MPLHTMPWTEILGSGAYLPGRRVTNDDLARTIDTSDEWIRTRTGIRERRVASEGETATRMAVEAARKAMEDAGTVADDLDAVLVSTLTPDHLLPSTACEVQAELGARRASAYDFATACSGFPYGLRIAEGHFAAGHAQRILLVCVEKMSAVLDWQDRSTCVLFGDGAGAVVLGPAEGERGLLASNAGADGRLASALWRPGGGAARPFDAEVLATREHTVRMQGGEVFKHAVRAMARSAASVLDQAGLRIDDVDLLIPHQANLRIIDAVRRQVGIEEERVFTNVHRYGNMSSASLPVAFHEARAEGRIGEGAVALLVAFGAGFTWGAALVRL